jgi:cytosine/uracil/thiamine/allantoin permease
MSGRLKESQKKESLRKAVRNIILGIAFLSGATTVLFSRKVQGLEEFDYAFGIVVGAIVYVLLKKVTGYKGKQEL